MEQSEKMEIIRKHLKHVYRPKKTLSGVISPPMSEKSLKHIAETHLRNFDKKTSIYQTGLYHK